jgi:hypothetical protein
MCQPSARQWGYSANNDNSKYLHHPYYVCPWYSSFHTLMSLALQQAKEINSIIISIFVQMRKHILWD